MAARKAPPYGDGVRPGTLRVVFRRRAALPPHAHLSHAEHVLTLVVEGAMGLEQAGSATAPAGSVWLVPAGMPHRVEDAGPVAFWSVAFCAGCMGLDETHPLMAAFRRARFGGHPVVPLSAAEQARAVRIFEDLDAEAAREDALSPEQRRSLLTVLLGVVQRAAGALPTAAPSGSLVEQALAVIQRRFLHPISLQDVAAAVGRSPGHVATTVRAATGHTVGELIRAARLAEAARRLLHTDDGVAEIARSVGWQDKKHFGRQFRAHYGQPPGAWRRARRAGHPA